MGEKEDQEEAAHIDHGGEDWGGGEGGVDVHASENERDGSTENDGS